MAVQRPLILLLDVVENTVKAMRGMKGMTVFSGSFGSPYRVTPGSGLSVVDSKDAKLKGYSEADGYVVDLRDLPLRSGPSVEQPPDKLDSTFTTGVTGKVDPRPYIMFH